MDHHPLWVFGYGSLIWDPGFVFAERRRATLSGWRRSFCMHSIHYRGTAEAPGLVLALDRDPRAGCEGIAYRVAPDLSQATLDYLRARELISYAYHEAWLPLALDDGRQVTALTFVINRDHDQYAGGLSLDDQARVIAERAGVRGPNADYLFSTASHLAGLGIPDPEMETLAARVRRLRGEPPPDGGE
jgi:cation transport protein ChaC